ncbi:MAG: hypothetical protein BEN19_03085 [Epulopiscium sp. Nuni2H_MBin003]|nr:MAG: hypothetical protein BEN19_03085 [Epulopiscium sp. Nuni2H_MBin003]
MKKIAAFGMAAIMTLSLLPTNLFANTQDPPTNIQVAVGHTTLQTTTRIEPNVSVRWTEPDLADKYTITPNNIEGSVGDINGVDYNAVKAGAQYEVEIGDLLLNGIFYEIELVAKRTQQVNVDQGTSYVISSTPEYKYFVTQFDTEATSTSDGGIEITFEYIPNINYEIMYMQGPSADGEFPEDSTSTRILAGSSILEDQIYIDESTGRERVKYNITSGISPGLIYSLQVRPMIPSTHYLYGKLDADPSTQDHKIVSVMTEIPLKVYNIGSNQIRLEWEIEDAIEAGAYNLVETRIIAEPIGSGGDTYDVITLYGNTGLVGYYEMFEPDVTTNFIVYFKFQTAEGEVLGDAADYTTWPCSNEYVYVPFSVQDKPHSPQVPDAWDQTNTGDASDYTVKYDTAVFTDADFIDRTFTVINTLPVEIQLVWDAPTTTVDEVEQVNYDLYYDIWVTEEKSMLDTTLTEAGINALYANVEISSADNTALIKNEVNSVIGFKTTLARYYDSAGTAQMLQSNKTYYIQIVAKQRDGGNYIYSEPTVVAITIGPNGEIFTPPVLGKPPLKVKPDSLTTTSADIIWRDNWYEIIAKDPDTLYANADEKQQLLSQYWNSKVYLTDVVSPFLYYQAMDGVNTEAVELIIEADLEYVKENVSGYDNNFIDRQLTLGSNIYYEMKTLEYDVMQNLYLQGTPLEEWLFDNIGMASDDDFNQNWEYVSSANEYVDERGLSWMDQTVNGLKPNTSYISMIRAYRILDDGTKLVQSYPSYVIFNTLTDFVTEEETPTVPYLALEGVTDTSIEVSFKYNAAFEYDIVYSRLDEPTTATVWDFTISDDATSEYYIPDGDTAYITIRGLFPDTYYNVWLKARQKVGVKESDWSNPVYAKTDEIGDPDAPTGFGQAASLSLLEIGIETDSVTKDTIIVEWTKVPDDLGTIVDGSVTKSYSYVLEFADNVEFLDSTVVTTTDAGGDAGSGATILAKNIVQFSGLKPNTPYYAQVKTVLTVTDAESDREIQRESDNTTWIRIFTSVSDDEYNGGDPDNVIVYVEDYTETYENGVWNYTIENAEGIISNLLNTNASRLVIDVSLYNGKVDTVLRNVSIPMSVITTLDNKNMKLEVITNIAEYEIKPAAVEQYTSLTTSKDNLVMSFRTVTNYDMEDITKEYPLRFYSAEQVSVGISSTSRIYDSLIVLEEDMHVNFKVDDSTKVDDLKMHIYNPTTASWSTVSHDMFETSEQAYLQYDTSMLGINTLYYSQSYAQLQDMPINLSDVSERYGISQIGTKYFGNTLVGSQQFVNLALGIAFNQQAIDLDATISADKQNQASNSGIYTSSTDGMVTREEAVSGLIKLYELKMGYRVQASSRTFEDVSAQYSENVSKAYSLGVISGIHNPTAIADYDYICDILVNLGM